MEITKELKEKLLNANSEEEVKALLGDQATEEEKAKVWNEIQRKRSQENLEEADDDELEVVNGGVCIWNGVYASDGKEVGCLAWDYVNWAEAKRRICPKSENGHNFVEVRRYWKSFNTQIIEYECTNCLYRYEEKR